MSTITPQRQHSNEHADQVWSDPSIGSKDSLAQFIRHVRDAEQDTE